ncbi:IclR family transcriptional regulator domain-containing protein [Pseudonocardia sp. HH130630-07]|uniref:IclR family transcriptional regulator domain-containing protein n=1 Tax=Pseudonocardia sp. HH130630-07 TaxID=1690815 RepID=UPI0012EA511D|nr:helix-turn-helix domain-containing protein [Pseudonocardia sp. HH130630-07]
MVLQTLDRGLTILQLLSHERSAGMTVAQLAAELDVHRAICYRLIGTLDAHGLTARTADGRVRLGAGIAALAASYEPQLRRAAEPVLAGLAKQTTATACIAVAQGDVCIYIMSVESPDAVLHMSPRVGSRHPLSIGAAGIAILAARQPSATDTDAVNLARLQGYSITSGQLQIGATGIAAAIQPNRAEDLSGWNAEASVSVIGTAELNIPHAVTAVAAAADHLTRLAAT